MLLPKPLWGRALSPICRCFSFCFFYDYEAASHFWGMCGNGALFTLIDVTAKYLLCSSGTALVCLYESGVTNVLFLSLLGDIGGVCDPL